MKGHSIKDYSFTNPKSTVRDAILSILSEEFPLNPKEIFSRVKKKSGREVTYQAVHKSIKQLEENKILFKEGKGYRISRDWVNQAKEYIQLVESTFQENPPPAKVLNQLPKTVKLHFTKYSELCTFVAELLVEYRERKKIKLPHYVILWHIWWPLKFDFSLWKLFMKMDDNNPDNRVVVAQNTSFEQMIGKYYRLSNPNDRLLLGLPLSEKIDEDIMVRGDLIIQVKYSKETKKELHSIFTQVTSLTDLFQLYFIQGKQDGPFDIDVTISENAAMAKLFREKVKSYFGE